MLADPVRRGAGNVRSTLTRGFMNLVPTAYALGYTHRADELLKLCEMWTREAPHAFVRFNTMIAIHRALLDSSSGRWEGLQDRAAQLTKDAADLPWIRTTAALLHETIIAARDATASPEVGIPVLESAHRTGYLYAAFSAASFLATRYLDHDRPAEAARVCEAEIHMIRRKSMWAIGSDVIPRLVRAYVADGRSEDARAAVSELERGVADVDSPAGAANLTLSRATLEEGAGKGARASQLYEEAADALASLPRVHESLRARADAGRCSVEAGGSPDLLFKALAGFDELGAVHDARRVRGMLRHLGIALPHPWRGGRRGYGTELSPREREVALLVANGLTNRQIAQRLFMSEKTVERHVSAALRKLAVDTRRAITQLIR